jgi:hypothetical protein
MVGILVSEHGSVSFIQISADNTYIGDGTRSHS